jgi:hypothetical protein
METTFVTRIAADGNNTGIEVPSDNLAELGTSKKPPVVVAIGGYSYRSTVATMGGKHLIPLSKAHREASGIGADDEVTVTLTLDDGPREVEIPGPLGTALVAAGLLDAFEALSYTKRKEACRQVAEAKAEDTRARRVQKVVDSVR